MVYFILMQSILAVINLEQGLGHPNIGSVMTKFLSYYFSFYIYIFP